MAIVTEFELGEGGEATIKLLPKSGIETPANIENVEFTSDNSDLALTVDVDNKLLFHALAAEEFEESDVELHLKADGKVGEGENLIDEVLVCHLRKRVAARVDFDVQIVK